MNEANFKIQLSHKIEKNNIFLTPDTIQAPGYDPSKRMRISFTFSVDSNAAKTR